MTEKDVYLFYNDRVKSYIAKLKQEIILFQESYYLKYMRLLII